MCVQRLKVFLNREGVEYETILHWPTHDAMETAESLAMVPHAMAETVLVRIDGELALAVFPANDRLDLNLLQRAVGAQHAEAIGEEDSLRHFPHCEPGAVPPFGNLYGVPVFVAEDLADSQLIAFNAGSHTEMIRLSYADFERLVNPTVVRLSEGQTSAEEHARAGVPG